MVALDVVIVLVVRVLAARSMPFDTKGACSSNSGRRQCLPGNEGTLVIHHIATTWERGYHNTSPF